MFLDPPGLAKACCWRLNYTDISRFAHQHILESLLCVSDLLSVGLPEFYVWQVSKKLEDGFYGGVTHKTELKFDPIFFVLFPAVLVHSIDDVLLTLCAQVLVSQDDILRAVVKQRPLYE